jgi:hypothetical protein
MKPHHASALAILGSILILIVVGVFVYHLYTFPRYSITPMPPRPSPFKSPLFDMLVAGALMVLVGELSRLRK